jgi:hypothetical protein
MTSNKYHLFNGHCLIYSTFGIQVIALRDESERKNSQNPDVQTKDIIDKLFKNS